MLRLARLLLTIGSVVSLGVVAIAGAMAGAHAAGWRMAAGPDAVLIDDEPAIARQAAPALLEYQRRLPEHKAQLKEVVDALRSVQTRDFATLEEHTAEQSRLMAELRRVQSQSPRLRRPPPATVYRLPYQTVFACAAALPLAWIAVVWLGRRRAAKRRRLHLCHACGYDIRSSPDRCPECGTPPPPSSVSM